MKTAHRGCLIALALVCIYLGLWSWRYYRPGVTRVNFERIKVGMTETEVENLLGGHSFQHDAELSAAVPCFQTWLGTEGLVAVEFDENGIVLDKNLDEEKHLMKTLGGLICDFIGF